MTAEVAEDQRQMILCALALTTLLRPGWEYACGEIADVFQRSHNVQRVSASQRRQGEAHMKKKLTKAEQFHVLRSPY